MNYSFLHFGSVTGRLTILSVFFGIYEIRVLSLKWAKITIYITLYYLLCFSVFLSPFLVCLKVPLVMPENLASRNPPTSVSEAHYLVARVVDDSFININVFKPPCITMLQ